VEHVVTGADYWKTPEILAAEERLDRAVTKIDRAVAQATERAKRSQESIKDTKSISPTKILRDAW
jgi:hypothetical protein